MLGLLMLFVPFEEATFIQGIAVRLVERMRIGAMVATGHFGPDAAHAAEEFIGSGHEQLPDTASAYRGIHHEGGDATNTTRLVKEVERMEARDTHHAVLDFRHQDCVACTFRARSQALLHVAQISGIAELSQQLTDARGIVEPSSSHGVLHVFVG